MNSRRRRLILNSPLLVSSSLLAVAACGSTGLIDDDAGEDYLSSAVAPDAGLAPEASDACLRLDGGILVNTCAKDAAAPRCEPRESPPFVPGPFKPPVGKHQGRCSLEQQKLLYRCVFTPAATDDPACHQFGTGGAGADCMACAFTEADEDAWGPAVIESGTARLNVAGCIGLASGDVGAGSCAVATQNAAACGVHTCDRPCLLAGGGQLDPLAYRMCKSNAASGVCAKYDSAAQTACAGSDATDTIASCAVGTSFAERLTRYIGYFCGAEPADASVTHD